MDTEKATHEIARMARLLDVSRSGYYAWAERQAAGPGPAQQRRDELTVKIIGFHAGSDQVYGSPRILADLRADGERVSAKTVAKLMRQHGIVGISPRKFTPITTVPGLGSAKIPDLVQRHFDQGTLNAVWTSDITYLGTDEGWLYLCAVRDGCPRRVIGWHLADHLRTDLVEAALRMPVTMRGVLPDQVIFHAEPPGLCRPLGPDHTRREHRHRMPLPLRDPPGPSPAECLRRSPAYQADECVRSQRERPDPEVTVLETRVPAAATASRPW
jgi:putative transposase